MSEILSDSTAHELAVGLAASQRIILEALFRAGTLQREEIVQALHEKADDLVTNHEMVEAANVLRLIHPKIAK